MIGWHSKIEFYRSRVKKKSYLSAEFLVGRFLSNTLVNMNSFEFANEIGIDFNELENIEIDAGLGCLAACFLDSLSNLDYPAIGYGIKYR